MICTNTVMVTGAYGFIGSNFAHLWSKERGGRVFAVDKGTYAARPENLCGLKPQEVFQLMADAGDVKVFLRGMSPKVIFHFGADTHVDNSINDSTPFLKNNVESTFKLLQNCREYYEELENKEEFLFVFISTDEVYGSLGFKDEPFTEKSVYAPNSPYSASKAACDHFVRAWRNTYKFPAIITHCSNNYGPRQHREKLIPRVIDCCFSNQKIPVYGKGQNVRDWIHVEDHCRALMSLYDNRDKLGDDFVFNIGADSEVANIDVVREIIRLTGRSEDLISYVTDRPGHDLRYAIDSRLLRERTGWRPRWSFSEGLSSTIEWYAKQPSMDKR